MLTFLEVKHTESSLNFPFACLLIVVGYGDHKNGEVRALSLAQLKTLLKKLSKLLVNVRIRNISGKNIIVDNGDTLGIVKSLKRFKQQTDNTNNSKTYNCLVNKINNK